ncbi:MAG: putative metal-binding motif-containing protein [Alphaproteobacteria bacterium]|nr:putative metal-binding motif-containing protein [Alphaproteobacteria bacterium]
MLTPCSSCGCHVQASACVCPHCDATLRVCGRGRAGSTAAALMGLALVACSDKEPDTGNMQMDYGVPDTGYLDEDGDGWSVNEGDCDDTNADIHPDAAETPGDSIDSNCDGDDDT